ncbi:MAG: triose-phosphate isomerase [Pseudomonadota bacterium]
MRTPIAAGNWKMHGTRAETASLLGAMVGGLDSARKAEVIVFPAFVHIADALGAVGDSGIAIGAQNVSDQPKGAFTGEVSAAMLADMGVTHTLVGHSERRALFGETDEAVAAKFIAASKAGLVPVLCVGESLEERESGATEAVVKRQLEAVVSAAGAVALNNAIVAYEPVWAIGTGKTASPEQAQAVHAFIRGLLAEHDAKMAGSLRILYGGSVKGSNAAELFGMDDVDGGLVGGASLNADDFLKICAAAG